MGFIRLKLQEEDKIYESFVNKNNIIHISKIDNNDDEPSVIVIILEIPLIGGGNGVKYYKVIDETMDTIGFKLQEG